MHQNKTKYQTRHSREYLKKNAFRNSKKKYLVYILKMYQQDPAQSQTKKNAFRNVRLNARKVVKDSQYKSRIISLPEARV